MAKNKAKAAKAAKTGRAQKTGQGAQEKLGAAVAAANAQGPGMIPAGAGEAAKLPATVTEAPPSEAENLARQSAGDANEIARRRHEAGAVDPENDGPEIGRVDNRTDTSFQTSQVPRPARPLTPVNATADRLGQTDEAALAAADEDPVRVGTGFPKKVRAIQMGYIRHSRRRAGDVFLIYNPSEFSPKWMEYAGSSEPEKITSGQQELEKQRQATLEDRIAAKKAGTGDTNVLGA